MATRSKRANRTFDRRQKVMSTMGRFLNSCRKFIIDKFNQLWEAVTIFAVAIFETFLQQLQQLQEKTKWRSVTGIIKTWREMWNREARRMKRKKANTVGPSTCDKHVLHACRRNVTDHKYSVSISQSVSQSVKKLRNKRRNSGMKRRSVSSETRFK